ncbi:transposase [Bradyrhizobium guangdongense]|uniref:Transposase n=1 Tax=Bradyrhizobium guangdongense TaxID=1325090 RepID=A0AA87WAV2_9BRAD|nr:transposase [Bradyrhizobium guangdongense]
MIKTANEFKDKTTAINQLCQTDFAYLKITGWGWYYLFTVLADFSRYIVALRMSPTMCASDVTATLDRALVASGLEYINIKQRSRLLSDNGSSYVADDLATWLKGKDIRPVRGAPIIARPRALASDLEEPHLAERIKRETIAIRRLRHRLQAA